MARLANLRFARSSRSARISLVRDRGPASSDRCPAGRAFAIYKHRPLTLHVAEQAPLVAAFTARWLAGDQRSTRRCCAPAGPALPEPRQPRPVKGEAAADSQRLPSYPCSRGIESRESTPLALFVKTRRYDIARPFATNPPKPRVNVATGRPSLDSAHSQPFGWAISVPETRLGRRCAIHVQFSKTRYEYPHIVKSSVSLSGTEVPALPDSRSGSRR